MSSMIGSMMGDTVRHGIVLLNGLPEEYAELSNHFTSTPENVFSKNKLWPLITYLRSSEKVQTLNLLQRRSGSRCIISVIKAHGQTGIVEDRTRISILFAIKSAPFSEKMRKGLNF